MSLDELVATTRPIRGRTSPRGNGAARDDGRDRFPGGGWSITQARTLAAELRPLAVTEPERIGLEMFAGLCAYTDDLTGRTFDRQWTGTERARVRAMVGRLLRSPNEDRLDRPVNASVGLAEGRRAAVTLLASSGWGAGLGRVLTGAYEYLDDLHGSAGLTRLLTRPERRAVAAALHPVPATAGPA